MRKNEVVLMLYAVVKQMEIPDPVKDPMGSLLVLQTFGTPEEAEKFKNGIHGFEVLPVPLPGEAY